MVWERREELDLNLCGVKFFTQTGKLPRYVREIFCDQVEKKVSTTSKVSIQAENYLWAKYGILTQLKNLDLRLALSVSTSINKGQRIFQHLPSKFLSLDFY